MSSTEYAVSRADMSPDGAYRFSLLRTWAPNWTPATVLSFIMLNPSIADATTDDPTIRRCVRFARDLGYDGLRVVNLYAYRATDSDDLRAMEYPIGGPRNDHVLELYGPEQIAEAVLEAVACELGAAALRMAADDAEAALPDAGAPHDPEFTAGVDWAIERLRRQADVMTEPA